MADVGNRTYCSRCGLPLVNEVKEIPKGICSYCQYEQKYGGLQNDR